MAKKSQLFTIFLFSLFLAVCTGKPVVQSSFLDHVPKTPYAENDYPIEQISGKSAFDYFKDEKITVGWNLGNTLDSHRDGYAGETGWGNPLANQELMNGVKNAGFNIIRIPVTWMGFIRDAPDYRLTPSRLSRVAEVAEMARNAGLKVIINVHHDGATDAKGDIGWLSIRKAGRSLDDFNKIAAKYVLLWKQIAIYFKNHGDWLIFEPFNELHDGNWGGGGDLGQFIALNKLNQLFVDTVRSTGVNNETRYLMIPAYCSDREQLLSSSFTLPTDTAENRLLVTYHYYDPYQFGIEGSRYAWGTNADKQKVDADFAPLKERFIDKKIPIVMGECGAVMQLYPNNAAREAEARQSRMDYISHVFSTAKKYGIVPIYWDNGAIRGDGEKFGLFDRKTGLPGLPENDVIIKLMISAVR